MAEIINQYLYDPGPIPMPAHFHFELYGNRKNALRLDGGYSKFPISHMISPCWAIKMTDNTPGFVTTLVAGSFPGEIAMTSSLCGMIFEAQFTIIAFSS